MNPIREFFFWARIVVALALDWLVLVPLLVFFALLALPFALLQDLLDRYRKAWRDDEYEYAREVLRCEAHRGQRSFLAATCLGLLSLVFAPGCAPAIQPVRYQPVTVITTKPCLAGKPLPPPATVRTQPACEKGRVDCLVDAAADIEDLKREAEASRRLLKECSR